LWLSVSPVVCQQGISKLLEIETLQSGSMGDTVECSLLERSVE
jgi:hypothetical protein